MANAGHPVWSWQVWCFELLDQSAIQACEECKATDLPTGAAAVLIVEIDGSADTAASASDAARFVASNFGATEQREVLVAGLAVDKRAA